MGLRIATNVQSLAAQKNLRMNNEKSNQTLERLSSGSRINRAGDDAAGLAISEKLNANIRSLKQANRNSNDAISMIQVAEGGMNEVGNILTRLRELSIQAASDTIGDTERMFVDKEVQQLKEEINRISGTTEFNGTKLLAGADHFLDFQVGIQNNPNEDRLTYDTLRTTTTLGSMNLDEVNTSTKEGSQNNLSLIDNAIVYVNENRSYLGALQNRLQSTINNLENYTENLATAKSRIRDTDIAEETANLVKQNIVNQANISVLSQANQNPQLALKLL